MRIFNKFKYTPLALSDSVIPKLEMQIEEFRCFHCGQHTRVIVKDDVTDWKAVAESYRMALEHQTRRFSQLVQDITVMHNDNPIIEYIQNEWRMHLKSLGEDLDKPYSDS